MEVVSGISTLAMPRLNHKQTIPVLILWVLSPPPALKSARKKFCHQIRTGRRLSGKVIEHPPFCLPDADDSQQAAFYGSHRDSSTDEPPTDVDENSPETAPSGYDREGAEQASCATPSDMMPFGSLEGNRGTDDDKLVHGGHTSKNVDEPQAFRVEGTQSTRPDHEGDCLDYSATIPI